MKNALLIAAALFFALGFVISLTIGVTPLVLVFVAPAVVLMCLSVYYDRIKQYVLGHKLYLLNCLCVNEVTGAIDLVLCQRCIPNCAENIRVDKFGIDKPCFICGHENGEEFPDTNEEE